MREGVAEVRDGRRLCLSLPLDYPGGSVLHPSRRPPVLRPMLRRGHVNFNFRLADLVEGRTDGQQQGRIAPVGASIATAGGKMGR